MLIVDISTSLNSQTDIINHYSSTGDIAKLKKLRDCRSLKSDFKKSLSRFWGLEAPIFGIASPQFFTCTEVFQLSCKPKIIAKNQIGSYGSVKSKRFTLRGVSH